MNSLEPGVSIARACVADAAGIAAVHVAAWRSAYADLLPSEYLAGLSVARHAAQHRACIQAGRGVLVARANGGVVGFTTVGQPRRAGLADGEIETLYVLDDWREQGLGRRLMAAGAAHLAGQGCRSLFLWVLAENSSRWFYERLGGRAVMTSGVAVAGRSFQQTAYVWDPIGALMAGS